jgi:glycosyltransferase involved in cell wall biosynthesis
MAVNPSNTERTTGTPPRVTIGLPVYNGEAYLAESIDSLLAQTFTDFELIISDNGSTDSTRAICLERAERDSRIRYHRNPENIGAMGNFNLVVDMARGEYFKWAAHDDVHAPGCVEACLEVLERDPSVVLAFPRSQDVDEKGTVIALKGAGVDAHSSSAVDRFRELIRLDYSCELVFGLMRTRMIRETQLLADYADCDRVLLAEIGLSGRIEEIPDYLFIHRQHDDRSVSQFRSRQYRAAWFNPKRAGRPGFPYTREWAGLVNAVTRARLTPGERMKCYGLMLRWAWVNRSGLIEDVYFALRTVLRPVKQRVTGVKNGSSGEGSA